MNQQSYNDQNEKSSKWLDRKWFKGETRRVMLFPFPLNTVKDRLKLAFSTEFKESRGFLFSTKKYKGYIHNNKVKVKFTNNGQSSITFHMVGELFEDPQGTRLEFAVSDTPLFYISILVGLIVIFSLKGIPGGLILGFIFTAGNYFLMAWHRSSAADSISSRLNMIISRQDSSA